MMKYWKDFIDSIDTDGGHVLILLVLVAIGAHWQASSIFDGAFGALLLKLKDAGTNRQRDTGGVTATAVVTETTAGH